MTTVRDARIRAAIRAIQSLEHDFSLLDPDEFYDIAVAVVDALFAPDPVIDNAELTESSGCPECTRAKGHDRDCSRNPGDPEVYAQ
jgi:hypothetical protein